MRRRVVMFLLGGVALVWPLAARAQQKAMPVIGYLSSVSLDSAAPLVAAFREGLGETGYVEGQNLTIEYRWAEGHYDRLPAFAGDLVASKVDLIASSGGPAPALAAKNATSTIPIVFEVGSDPVTLGLVASLARPGGNLTGVSFLTVELLPKLLELTTELVPEARVIAALVNPNNQNTPRNIADLEAAARAKGVQLHILKASTDEGIDATFASLGQLRAGGLVIAGDPFFNSRREQLVALVSRNAIPTVYFLRDFVTAGGLVSYGASVTAAQRQVGRYAGKILKGAKPADLPVQQSTTFELVVNMKTAKALGLTIPRSILVRADEVID